MQEEVVKQFFEFIYQRQLIWHKRFVFKQSYPWTEDVVLQKYKFCNVYRELDRCSQHLINNIINKEMGDENKLLNIVAFRMFNCDGFFTKVINEPLVMPVDFKIIEDKMDKYIEKNGIIFNTAYLVSQVYYDKNYRARDKHVQLFLSLRDTDFFKICKNIMLAQSARKVWQELQGIRYVGKFLAYQILIDLSYIQGFLKFSIEDFCDVGPGALPSLVKIYGDEGNEQAKCKELCNMQQKYLPKSWDDIYYKDAYFKNKYLSLNNIEHCLCEFRKYTNLKNGNKQRKRYFKGREK